MFISVDLPAPFSPSSACTSPCRRSRLTLSFASTPGNRFVIPRSSRRGASAIARASLSSKLAGHGARADRLVGGDPRIELADPDRATACPEDDVLAAVVDAGHGVPDNLRRRHLQQLELVELQPDHVLLVRTGDRCVGAHAV